MRRVITAIALLGALLLVGCDGAAKPQNVQPATASGMLDYGNNVYYFPFTGSTFGNKLSAFVEEHPELELVSMSSKNEGGYGSTQGYFVYFREKGPCVCDDMGPGDEEEVRKDSR